MGLASGLVAIGLFLLGGAFSIFRADHPEKGRTTGQVVFAGLLVLAAALAIASGVLRF
ncbi:hypothetical protein [Klenkia taihuensis]|uniref:Uncharacterized protein n=1 Tax=Klenkia taihuensis TaxID=1225127 RepID=A0A1I1T296_9ACTN|nr:hypothetical protein [Klenkia taihuensis]GHE13037.1 hypothetical protein GCM10011381_33420 [Klenkia taihuensis]SFD52809.1 hypothetical protein SAMN05661030_3630 [Klenkia taihuensis]